MTTPTIARRLERKYLAMTGDTAMRAALDAATPAGWSRLDVASLDDIGDWNEILLYRFLLLDLDDETYDPVEVVQALRTEHMLNIAVFCFGGDKDLRDALRMARADRFFDRDEMLTMLPRFFEQYAW